MVQERSMGAGRLWPRRLLDWTIDRLLDPDFNAAEVQCALLLLLWGVLFLDPYPSFANGRAYSVMAEIAPEAAWGAFMVGISLWTFAGVILWRPKWRIWAARTRSPLWLVLGLLLFAGNQSAVLPLLCFAFSLTAAWSYWRLSVKHRAR